MQTNMNNFRLKCLLQLWDKHLSFHPAARELKKLMPIPEEPIDLETSL